MSHKIVAIEMRGSEKGMELIALTQSPRGTKLILKKIPLQPADSTKDSLKTALASGIEALLGPAE